MEQNYEQIDAMMNAVQECPMCGKQITEECEKGYPGDLCPKCWEMKIDADEAQEEGVA